MADDASKQTSNQDQAAPQQGEPEQQAGENRPEAGNQKGAAKGKQKSNKADKDVKVHPANQEAVDAEENAPSPVQPIQVVRNKPELNNEEAETVTAANKPNLQQSGEQLPEIDDDPTVRKPSNKSSDEQDLCWNCANNGKKSVLKNGVCSNCGFDKSKLYNLDLEARKAQAREAAAAQYNY